MDSIVTNWEPMGKQEVTERCVQRRTLSRWDLCSKSLSILGSAAKAIDRRECGRREGGVALSAKHNHLVGLDTRDNELSISMDQFPF